MDNMVNNEKLDYSHLLEQHRNMIYSIINEVINKNNNSCAYRVSEDDLFQEGCIALYKAYVTYKENYAKFSTFAYVVIKRRVLHKYREFIRPLLYETYSYDAVRQIDYFACYGIQDMHDVNVQKELLKDFSKTLNDTDAMILSLRQKNVPYKTITQVTHLNQKQIDYRLRKTKQLYRAYLNRNYFN